MKDYYKILELPPSATLTEIKAAYRRLAHQYHPDKNNNDLYAAAQFEVIKEAYEILSNPSKKEYYLQQRWYNQSINKKSKDTVITPVTVLKRVLELDKYVATLDVHRMDEEGLFNYICSLLPDDTITKLNTFNEPDINRAIITSVLKSGRSLSWTYANPLGVRLMKLNMEESSSAAIAEFLRHSKQSAAWNKYRVWLLLLIVVILSLVIYSISN